MYEHSANLYDFIHSFKEYETEVEHIHRLIQTHQRIDSRTLLDVGCGTGQHLFYLQDMYQIMGLDLDEGLLAVARDRLPNVTFHEGNMQDFDLAQTFDVIICLFGAIAYVQTLKALEATLTAFARHLNPNGVLLLEPFIKPEDYTPGIVHSLYRDEPYLKVARFSNSTVDKNRMIALFHYLVGSSDSIDYFTEMHELGLFTSEEILDALESAGFVDVQSPSIEVFRRGIYVGIRSGQ
jgi:ubiquinone/menaquinone biosynthesis C-methylase UbiE